MQKAVSEGCSEDPFPSELLYYWKLKCSIKTNCLIRKAVSTTDIFVWCFLYTHVSSSCLGSQEFPCCNAQSRLFELTELRPCSLAVERGWELGLPTACGWDICVSIMGLVQRKRDRCFAISCGRWCTAACWALARGGCAMEASPTSLAKPPLFWARKFWQDLAKIPLV